MSAGSFDDSSTLVDITSPTNDEQKQFSVKTEDTSETEQKETADVKTKTKKSKGLKGFLKRAKSPQPSPLKSPSKSPLRQAFKSLPKHHSKSHQKSPSKSPSKENLTEEFKNLEQKISEKKSEEWLAFKEMQERIKQTVLQTQTSLIKYTGQTDDKDDQQSSDIPSSSWTGFNEEDTLEPEESDNPSISVSWASYDNKQCSKNYLEASRGLDHLDTTPIPSPPVTPAPPRNSRISSMENLMEEKIDTSLQDPPVQQEVDLLGLMRSDEPAPPPPPSSSSMLNQDLLGLDSFMPSTESQPANTGSKTLEGYTYSLSSALNQSEKSTQKSSPMVDFDQNINKPEPLGFDADVLVGPTLDGTLGMLGGSTYDGAVDSSATDFMALGGGLLDPAFGSLDQVVPDTAMQMFSQTIVDDFADLDPMKADAAASSSSTSTSPFNPFSATSSSSPIKIGVSENTAISGTSVYSTSPQPSGLLDMGAQMSSLYGSSPQAAAPVDMGAVYSSSPKAPLEHDIMSKIKRMSVGSSPASPAKRPAPKKPEDPFSFVKTVMTKKPGETESKETLEQEKSVEAEEKLEPVDTAEIEQSDGNVLNNPFLTGEFPESDGGDGLISYSNEAFNGSVAFGIVESGDPYGADKSSDFGVPLDNASGDFESEWTEGAALGTNASVDLDSAWESAFTSDTKTNTGDVWGSKPADSLDGGGDSSSNPFQDDFSTLEKIPFEMSEAAPEKSAVSVNPFLSDDISDTPPVIPTGANNPFLEFTSAAGADTTLSTNMDDFFKGSMKQQAVDDNVEEMDDFDPFKVTAHKVEPVESVPPADSSLDFFGQSSSSDVKQSSEKTAGDDSHAGFSLEIKPVTEKKEGDSTEPPPSIKPPPRPPRSPQPPRENPFDRESPPEENFAQFEIMDNEKQREPTKSISTESTTSEEEEVLEPLEPFLPKIEKEGFKLMLRYPTKKKLTGNRYWKNVFVRVSKQNDGPVIKVYNDANDALTMQELPLQPCYSLSEMSLQQYDQYGKIHTVKLQYIFYKERVGIRSERITPSFVRKPKATMILDHSPQVSELLKFGCLDKEEMNLFMQEVEDALMNLEAHREKTLTYTKDEVTAELHDEYKAELDKHGKVLSQKARVRIFVLAFVTGMPTVEVGLNDKRRRGKEVVGRCDIIPIKTEEWIRLEDVQFHCCVDKAEFDKTNNIKFHPLDACQFELLRYRVRPRVNKELPLQLTIQQIMKDRKIEIRCDLLVTGYHSYSKKHGQFPCEDIEVRFPIPETWIYLFRYERRFGYGSFRSATRKPGKIKGLERLTMMTQGAITAALMEADVGTAKYEHVYRSVVWRIPRLPVRNQGAYTSHLMKLKLELGPHDEIPDSFEKYAYVEFTMPCSTVSQSQIRSISVTNPNPPEKWVRYLAHYDYRIEIEHLDDYPENMRSRAVYEEEFKPSPKVDEEENHEEVEGLAPSDSDDSSD